MEQWFGTDGELVLGVTWLVILLLLILVLIQSIRLSGLKKRFRRMMEGAVPGTDLESVIVNMQEQLANLQSAAATQQTALEHAQKKIKKVQGKVGVQRYNAFAERGSDMSFSIAFINEDKDGVVLSGIHSRDHSFLYAKPVEKGQSPYTLTPEEKKVIDQTAAQPD